MHLPSSNPSEPTRRAWVKRFMLCSAAALTGPRWASGVLAEVNGARPGILRIQPSSFPALASPGGSIQLTFLTGTAPLTLNRVSADRFVALDSICTHAGCTVASFFDQDNHMRCPCHGSRYDIEGRVFRDATGRSTEPAPDDLARFDTSYDPATGIISVTIPSLALQIDSISVHQQAADGRLRIKLVFPVTAGADYEIRHQTDLSAPSQPITFSRTPDGAAVESSLRPQINGNFTAYVDAPAARGFFVVSLKLTQFS